MPTAQPPAPPRIRCRGCGLVMPNGFCLHGSVDDALAARSAFDMPAPPEPEAAPEDR